MFYMLGTNKPSKKTVYRGTIEDLTVEYIATRTREIVNAYNEEKECVASIYTSALMVKDSDVDGEKVQVSGNWELIKGLAGLGEVPTKAIAFEDIGFVYDEKGKGSANKVKGIDYEEHGSLSTLNVDKLGASIEDYLYEIVTMNDLKESLDLDLDWAKKKDYRVLVDDDEIEEFIKGLEETTEIVGFDTETTGLLVNRTKIDKLVGISMSYKDNSGVYFPLKHKRFDNVHMGEEKFLELLKPYCDRDSDKAKDLVTHNGGFDWRVLKMYGWDLNIVFDTWIRFSLMAIAEAKYMSGLKGIAKRELGHDVVEMDKMFAKRSKADIKAVKKAVFEQGLWVDDITRYKLERAETHDDVKYDFRFASYDFSELYGSADADFPRLIHKLMDKTWDKTLDFTYRMEIALIPVIGEQEYYGVKAVEHEFRRLYAETENELADLEVAIYKEADQKFNLNSPIQKAKVLFDDVGCPFLPRFRTKKGGRSTNGATMDTLKAFKNKDGSPKYPIVSLMAKYTKKNTLITNFYKKLPLLIHDGFLFPSYNQMGTETGRLSCYAPNLQQTEGTSRHYMVPDSDDYYFMICDYSQVEYRLMAGLSGEKKVVDFFSNNPEADYHILAYANMMGKKYEDVTGEERKTGKVLNFGTTYGLEDENLALKLYGESTEFHQRMARQARDLYFAGVPVLRDYFEEVRDEAETTGYAKTKFGRIRHIKEFQDRNGRKLSEYQKGSGRRKAGNMPVQGTAADIQKMAMTRIRNAFRKIGLFEDMVRLVMNIHDEVVIQVHKSLNTWWVLSIVRDAMEMDMSEDGFPPLYIGANVGYSWADGKDDDLEAPVLLMDEKIKEVKEKLSRGEKLEPQKDQKMEWLMDIQKFALRQVKKEMEANGYLTVEECHSNGRLVKYSRTFKNADRVIEALLTDTPDEVWVGIDKLLAMTEYEIRTVKKEVKKGIKESEEFENVKNMVKDRLRYNKKNNVLSVRLLDKDSEFFTVFDKMLVNRSAMGAFKEGQKYVKVRIDIDNEESFMINQRGMVSGMVGLLKKYMEVHLTGGSYGYYEEDIEDVGVELMIQ